MIDEVQRVPALLNEAHRLIESRKLRFVLTGSSARTLRRKGVNLLAGRALTYAMYPLTAVKMGDDFDLAKAAQYGLLPSIETELDPKKYLESYIATYLREEVLQEGLIRNLGAFARFLKTASFSQGSLLTISEVAWECASQRKTVEGYFDILDSYSALDCLSSLKELNDAWYLILNFIFLMLASIEQYVLEAP